MCWVDSTADDKLEGQARGSRPQTTAGMPSRFQRLEQQAKPLLEHAARRDWTWGDLWEGIAAAFKGGGGGRGGVVEPCFTWDLPVEVWFLVGLSLDPPALARLHRCSRLLASEPLGGLVDEISHAKVMLTFGKRVVATSADAMPWLTEYAGLHADFSALASTRERLRWSCRTGCEQTVMTLVLDCGADVNEASGSGETTPLFLASRNGHVHCVRALVHLADAASPGRPSPSASGSKTINIDAVRRSDGVSSLFIACQKGHAAVLRALLDAGADTNLVADDGSSPLFVASQAGHAEVVKALLDAGADPHLVADDGATPLFISAERGHADVASLLANSRGGPSLVNRAAEDGASPLIAADRKSVV